MAESSQDVDAARAFYTRISRVYDQLADADEHAARERGVTLLDVRRGEHVLEIGFGTGRAMVRLAEAVGPDGWVYGIDLSEGMARVARERLEAAGLAGRCTLQVAAVPPIPQPDGAFDAAFLAFTLELFPADTIPLVLAEVHRALRPTGRVAAVSMGAPAAGMRGSFAERMYTWMHRHFPHIVDCRPIDLPAVLAANGFAVEREERVTIWTMPVSICLARAGSEPAGGPGPQGLSGNK